MKRFWEKGLVILLSAGLTFSLAGCGSSSGTKNYDSAMATADMAVNSYEDEIYEESAASEEYVTDTDAGGKSEQVTEASQTERKLIRNVSMSVETEAFDELINTVTNKTKTLGGYIESSNVWINEYYGNGDKKCREGNYTIRIPKDRLDEFISVVESGTNVTQKEESVDDVTLTYVDLESHKKALLTEQERLLELMSQATDMESILTIEERLTNIRYQIQSMESQLRTYDNQVDYSTLTLRINEVVRIQTVDDQSIWSEIATGFGNNLYDVMKGIRNFFVWIIVHIPNIIVWLIIIFVIMKVFKKIFGKKNADKHDKKEKKRFSGKNKIEKSDEITVEASKDEAIDENPEKN